MPNDIIITPASKNISFQDGSNTVRKLMITGSNLTYEAALTSSNFFTTNGKGRIYATASYALASAGGGGGSSLTGQTDSATPFETALGYQALNVNTGVNNTAVGYQSLLLNTTGTNNSAFGYKALASNTVGLRNSAFGVSALQNNTTNNNSAFGHLALTANTTGVANNAFGYRSLASNTTGKGNSAFGHEALKYTISAVGNSAFGKGALLNNTGGSANTAFGYESSTTINGFTGAGPMFAKSGFYNSSFGYRSLYFNVTGNNNSAFGYHALRNTTVSNQTAVGYTALTACTTGNGGNTALGSGAGSSVTFGYNNTLIGLNAASVGATPLTTGQNNTCLGNGAVPSSATVSNTITLGNSSITTLRCQVTTITALSDFRDKTDINDIQVGLSFVEKLRPVTFKWDKREWYTDGNRDGSKKEDTLRIGFIAQELKELQESENATYLNLVLEDNPDKLEATPGNLMTPLIKAVQELSVKVKTLEAKVQALENK